MKLSAVGFDHQLPEGEKRCLNSELWHACAGPLVSLPTAGSRVVYFPQGHSEQVVATTNKEVDAHTPNYPSLPPQLVCQLHNVTMHADVETDEVYAQMTLQPLNSEEQKEPFLPADLGAPSKQPTNYFCKTLTASDTSTHGGFSVPRRAAEKVFPPLDFTQQPPAQELIARDLHGNEWKFRHIFRGQPKRHLLTTGWSVFVSAKKLIAGDSVLFIWNEKNQLLLGIRRASRPQTVMPSSVLSSDSMHLGLLAAAAHAAATKSRFTVFYNPRASPSEFVIPLTKYVKAVYHTRVSIGMRFRILFETEESSVRRYMGTITGISDLDPARWPNSHWRSVKVGWDESTAGDRQPRVSLWEIEPLTTFPMYPSQFPLRLKRPWPPGLPSFNGMKNEELGMNSPIMWLRGDPGIHQSLNFQGIGIGSSAWMQPRLDGRTFGMQTDIYRSTFIPDNLTASYPQPNPFENRQQTLLPSVQPFTSSSQSNSPISLIQDPIFSDSHGNPVSDSNVSSLQSLLGSYNIPRSSSILTSDGWPAKRVAIDPQNVVSLPPFPGRECSIDLEPNNDPQSNLLFGDNIDNSNLLMQSGISNYTDNFRINPSLTPSSCINESGFMQSPKPMGQSNPSIGTFVKVYKSGCFGRSIDLAKFSSYNELRSELAQLFGLEGQLEDPLRSGWQLVFVDRENDVLLLGDDPWPEFTRCVSCIKILSPQEVQQMGKLGLEILNSVPIPKPSDIGYESYGPSRQESMNLSNGIVSVGSLEY